MRIGIITILKAGNYGADLQACALQKELEGMGHDCEVIDFLHYKHPDYVFTKRARPLWSIGFRNSLKEHAKPWMEKAAGLLGRRSGLRAQRFAAFHPRHTRMSAQTYRSMEELYAADLPYEVFMVGSDQVWNPRTGVSLEPYFLTFAPPEANTVSYASSFGVSTLPPQSASAIADGLAHIRHLSVREKQGVDIIRNLTGREAEHVLDPTLLLTEGEWAPMAVEPEMAGPFVLLYDLIHSPAAVDLALRVGGLHSCPVVRIVGSGKVRRPGLVEVADAGPAEFLGWFRKAAFVVTNSFHGTAFSINFRKPFFTVVPAGKSNTSRLHSLTETLGLGARLVPEGTNTLLDGCLALDYAEASVRLEAARSQSVDFLMRSLLDGMAS